MTQQGVISTSFKLETQHPICVIREDPLTLSGVQSSHPPLIIINQFVFVIWCIHFPFSANRSSHRSQPPYVMLKSHHRSTNKQKSPQSHRRSPRPSLNTTRSRFKPIPFHRSIQTILPKPAQHQCRMDLDRIKQEKNLHRNRIKEMIKSYRPEITQKKSQVTIQSLFCQDAFQNARSVGLFFSLPHELQTGAIITRAFENKTHVFLPRVTDSSTSVMEFYQVFDENDYTHGGDLSKWNILEPTPTLSPRIITDSVQPLIQSSPEEYDYIARNVNDQNSIKSSSGRGQSQTNTTSTPDTLPVSVPEQQSTNAPIGEQIEPGYDIPRPNLLDDDCIRRLDLLLCPFVVCDLQLTRIGYGGGFYDRYIERLNTRREELGLSRVPVWGIGLEDQILTNLTLPFEQYDIKMDAVIAGQLIFGKL